MTAREARIERNLAELRTLLGSDPELRARYDAATMGEIPAPDLEVVMSKPDQPVSLRIPGELLDQADELIEPISRDPVLRAAAGGPLPRAAVLRLAIAFGLDALRRKYGEPPKG